MIKLKRRYLLLILVFVLRHLSCQIYATDSTLIKLQTVEQNINSCFNKIAGTKDDAFKLKMNDSIIESFADILTMKGSLQYSFDSLEFVGKVNSPDNVFRIINWNLEFSNGTYKYYGFIQYFNKKNKQINLFQLIDKSDSIPDTSRIIYIAKFKFVIAIHHSL